MSLAAGTVLIGIGNPHRRDDAVGLHVVRRLRGRLPGHVELYRCRGEVTELMDRWRGAGKAVIVDAMDGGREPGDIVRLDAAATRLPPGLGETSTHGLGLSHAVELARTLDELPAELIVFGIQGADFRPGETLSAAVAGAVEACCRRILREVRTPA